ncbi:hypothetical protein BLOT_011547 [Blomia tropicalis]|nr:hypothetical protein BLOT_011547 [Blomia tropicalis]
MRIYGKDELNPKHLKYIRIKFRRDGGGDGGGGKGCTPELARFLSYDDDDTHKIKTTRESNVRLVICDKPMDDNLRKKEK